jgi:hypothetical protein
MDLLTEFEFSVSLNTDERTEVTIVRETLADVQELLRDIERSVSGKKSAAHWLWQQPDPQLTFAARVNGVSAETLSRVVEVASEGFEQASEAAEQGAPVQWPAEFGAEAQKRARRILERLERLESITIAATGHDPVVIEKANLAGKMVTGRQSRRRIWSSVEGVMRMISGGEKVIRAGIREHGSGTYVVCALDAEAWHEKVRGWWDQRVIVDGRVAYADDGRPLSIIDVTDIRPRPSGPPLTDFLGVAPGLARRGSDDDVIAEMRGHG